MFLLIYRYSTTIHVLVKCCVIKIYRLKTKFVLSLNKLSLLCEKIKRTTHCPLTKRAHGRSGIEMEWDRRRCLPGGLGEALGGRLPPSKALDGGGRPQVLIGCDRPEDGHRISGGARL
jgi:hypothetical protein